MLDTILLAVIAACIAVFTLHRFLPPWLRSRRKRRFWNDYIDQAKLSGR